ncbi:MAG: polyphosphate kinase 2 family protein, partial [Pseudomonadota bacterium]
MNAPDISLSDNPWLTATDGSFDLGRMVTLHGERLDRKPAKKTLRRTVQRIATAQRMLYAQTRFAVLLVFQAMDAAGKDSTIRNVLSGVNPAGCQVWSF